MRRRFVLLRTLVLTTAWALASLPALAGALQVRDSAGVQIIENAKPALAPARGWRIDPKPILSIGGGATDSDTLNELALVMGVTRLADGRLAVGVQASSTVRFYDAQGKLAGSAGRKGQGPGEFRQVMGVWVTRGDTLVVTDLGELEIFTSSGKFVRQGASRSRGDRFVYPSVVLNDGSYLGAQYNERTAPPAGRSRQAVALVRVSRDGERVDTVGSLTAREEVYDGRNWFGTGVAFSTGALLAGDENRIFVGSPTRLEITEFSMTGRPTRVLRLPGRPAVVDNEAIRAYREWYQSLPGEDGRPMQPAMKARYAQLLERTVYAEHFPPFLTLLVDRMGHLWAQRFDYHGVMYTPGPARTQTMPVPSRWEVFDRAGVWLGTVELPARFTPVEIGADYVAGVARDEDDVEYVHVYRLRKPLAGAP